MLLTDRLMLSAISPAEALRIVSCTPGPDDHWHPEYPLDDELDPLRTLAASAAPDPVFTLYVIRTRNDGLAVGGIGFFGAPDKAGTVELGYGLVEAVRGRGLATEALGAATQLALSSGARRVTATAALDNGASQRVLTKAGFWESARSQESVSYDFKR